MTARPLSAQALAILLAWIAGATDAIGFLLTGGFFVSFMSGNSTRLGVGIAGSDHALATTAAALVTLFVVGVAAATLIGARLGGARALGLLLAQAALLALAAALMGAGRVGTGTAAAVIAMAFANSVVGGGGDDMLGVTYVTGALVRVGRGLAGAIAGGARLGWLPDLLLWVGLAAGAVAGAALEARLGSAALWMPAAATLIAALCQSPRTRYADRARGPGGRRRG